MAKDQRRNNNTTLCSNSRAVVFRKRITKFALIVLFISGSAIGAYSIKAFSVQKSGTNSLNTKIALQVSALGQTPTVRFIENGKPWINLAEGREVESGYAGDEEAVSAIAKNSATPLSLTAADFDADGVQDVVAGYAGPNGGIVVLMRGNADSLYPNSPESRLHRENGTYTDAPFLSPALVFAAPTKPEYLAAGDFDGDGRVDLVMTNRESNQLFMMKGTGKAAFESAAWLDLPGKVNALAVGDVNRADGLMDIVVATSNKGAAQMLVLESPNGAFKGAPEIFALPAEAASLAIGQLDMEDGFVDIAVAAGRNLLVTHGRDRKLSLDSKMQASVAPAKLDQRTFAISLKGVAVGDFTDSGENDLAVLGDDGSVQLLSRNRTQKGALVDGLQDWNSKRLNSTTLVQATRLISAHLSSLPVESLIVLDSASNEVQVLTDGTDSGRKEAQKVAVPTVASALLEVDNGAAAVLAARLNGDALSDLVMLRRNQSGVSVVSTTAPSTFTVTNTMDTGVGSLHQAIIDANTNPGADVINFAIGSGVQTINLASELPAVTDPVTIDATTQPGFAGSPIIEINGTGTSSGRIFKVSAGSSTLRGLVLNRCLLTTMSLENNGNDKVEGCYIGTDVAGTAALPNGATGDGVSIFATSGNVIGGTTTAARNVISGNAEDGVKIVGTTTTGNSVQGNYIGTNAAGTAALANHANGVYLNSKLNTIGGATSAARNIISGNILNGVEILNDVTITGNKVQGNFIGVSANGSAAIGNGDGVAILNAPTHTIGGTVTGAGNVISGNAGSGILIMESSSTGNLVQGNAIGSNGLGNTGDGILINLSPFNTIGGVVPNSPNTISFNGGKGIVVVGTSDDSFRQNSILSNTGIGIDLGDDGVTPNDMGDLDAGANDLLNFPVITFSNGGASTTVQGTYNSIPAETFTLEFFLNASCDSSGFGEGETYIGTITVTTNASGNATFNSTFAATSSAGQSITATATKATGSTSEFSQCVPICVYSISPMSQSFGQAGGPGSVTVTATGGCSWTAVSNDAFITVTSGASGTGNGTVNYSVAAKADPGLRTGTITIAGLTFTVNQMGPCIPISISPTLNGPSGSTLTVPINVGASLTGLGITAYDFVLTFNSAIVGLANPSFDTTGTMSSGFTITPNTSVPGQITVSASGGTPLTGSGVLLNLRITLTGAVSSCSNLAWTSFNFPGGNPCTTTSNGQVCVVVVGSDTIGLFNPSTSGFFLRNSNSTGVADVLFTYGPAGAGWIPLTGDWNGDGVDTIGLYNPATSTFFLRNSNSTGVADLSFSYGPAGAGWLPLAGDWDGDGVDTIGLYNPTTSTFFLRNTNSAGVADVSFAYGPAGAGWKPIVGDWNGDGIDTIGLYNPTTSTFFLRNTNSTGVADLAFTYNPSGAAPVPLVRDWNGDGVDTIGLYNPTTAFGPAGAGWTPLVGDWDGL